MLAAPKGLLKEYVKSRQFRSTAEIMNNTEVGELKADQMAWVGLLSSCKAQIEEIIFADLIYC